MKHFHNGHLNKLEGGTKAEIGPAGTGSPAIRWIEITDEIELKTLPGSTRKAVPEPTIEAGKEIYQTSHWYVAGSGEQGRPSGA